MLTSEKMHSQYVRPVVIEQEIGKLTHDSDVVIPVISELFASQLTGTPSLLEYTAALAFAVPV
jgi:hypothetical protein